MDVMQGLRSLLVSRVPARLPNVVVTTFFPRLNNPVTLISDGAANVYGVNATALLANGNLWGLWVVGIYACNFSAATIDYSICISSDPTAAAPITILAEAPFWSQTTVVGDTHRYVPLYRPVYIPVATILCMAASSGNAAGDTVDAWAVCVRNMEN